MTDIKENILPEAPASATVKIKSKDGFEWLFTMRDEKASNLMFKMKAMEAKWLSEGFTPLAQGFKKDKPPVEYLEGAVCPLDAGKIVKATKKDGSKFLKCENNKFINGQQVGCKWLDWNNTPPKATQMEEYDSPDL